MDPVFFARPDEWCAWLAEHHDTVPELWVGFHKKASGRPSITWPEAVDPALCPPAAAGCTPVGLAAFQATARAKSGVYSYEQRKGAKLPQPLERQLRRKRRAWRFFQAQPPGGGGGD